jgi:hypothetical protein
MPPDLCEGADRRESLRAERVRSPSPVIAAMTDQPIMMME